MKISTKELNTILTNPEAAAKFGNLVYINEDRLDILRKRRGEDFVYLRDNKPLKNSKTIERIEKLVIPPAWENVKIAAIENAHLQVIGEDLKKRKQYRYHELWTKIRNCTKFYKMSAFGKALPLLRKKVDDDLALKGMPQKKALALIVRLMDETHIRIGNEFYAKNNNSYGLSTMRTRHLKTVDNKMKFHFKGKRGKQHKITIKNKRLKRLVMQCKEIPGWELFQYYDETGQHQSVDSGMVNDYIHQLSGDHFSAKDFRTWAATTIFFNTLFNYGIESSETSIKKNILKAYDAAAEGLGNTRNVCRKYYVHPEVVKQYETGSIESYFRGLNRRKEQPYFSKEESAVLDIIKEYEIVIDSI
ncbi:DNA topoisomerase IB [Galbibacter mesophilus]|uniref:DNA topoisomerase IB n=1 Tax=Galbibacter mesophilus TaxID=379069 RepID=UPI00191E5405|nr:DNA topoisomerase IB [Galbibacter mesophilus]MCM5661353.1 DNA topoisomerase IB [Galbibacter mesophilus]